MESNRTLKLKHAWAEMLFGLYPLDLDKLDELKRHYDLSLRADKNHDALYAEQRSAYLAESRELQDKTRAELASCKKIELAQMLGMGDAPDGWTKDDLIISVITSKSQGIENEHSRVRRIWAAMSEEEQCK